MRKKNTLYTVNKWNRPLFMPEENLFKKGGFAGIVAADKAANPWDYAENKDAATQFLGTQRGQDYANSKNILGISKADNPFSKMNLAGGLKGIASTPIGGSLISGAAGAIGGLAGNLIGGGLHSGAGDAIGSIGGTIGGAVGSVNPVAGAIISAGSQILGGVTNAAFGTSVDEEKLNAAKEGTSQLNNFVSNAGSFDDIQGVQSVANVQDAYKGGWFTSGDAKRKNEELKRQRAEAMAFVQNSVINNVNNLAEDQLNNALSNYAAYGGPLDTLDMGAIDYGFMSDYLAAKKKQAENKNQMTNMFMGTPSTMFAIGGDLQTNGADYSTGLAHIDAGLSHEMNPNDGVQLGVDSEGVPNLVEEGETVWNDYVFSNRITLDDHTKALLHFPKKKDITYADAAKKLEKEISERPNDPISQAGFNAQMEKLEEQQERQKQEMEAERAKAAFEALSPEEQVAVMENAAQQEAMAQQAAQEQAIAEQQAMQQPSPEEAAMMQQQMMQADGTQAMLGQEPQMAEGGNLFEKGGKKKNVGSWKNDKENHWDVFTKPGLKRYLENLRQRLKLAPDEETQNAIRKEAMNELNSLQQSYYDYVREDIGKPNYEYDENVLNHQKLFDRLYGNTGFYTTDENGNVRNLIAEAINLPEGAATKDKPDSWYDGYNGPRTSIRNFGSTEYGNDTYYKDLADEFAELGLTYAPNKNWQYGENQLYGLSLPEVAKTAEEEQPKVWDWNIGDWIERPTETASETATTPAASTPPSEEQKDIAPNLRSEWTRYAGLFGPAVGLGLQMAGVGRPDTASLDAVVSDAGRAHLAKYKPLGNYLTYRPMDIWFEQNRMDANARATDRAIMNSGANQGSKMAGLLASGYNSQLADGELYRKALEYNDALRKQVAEFNRGTDQFNAEAYNRTSQFNADALNRAGQHKGSLALQAAAQKLDADAGWYNGIYGNLSGLFKGISDLGRENADRNMVARMWADGLAGTATPDTYTASDYLKWKKQQGKKAKGGKNRKKHDIIL